MNDRSRVLHPPSSERERGYRLIVHLLMDWTISAGMRAASSNAASADMGAAGQNLEEPLRQPGFSENGGKQETADDGGARIGPEDDPVPSARAGATDQAVRTAGKLSRAAQSTEEKENLRGDG